MFSDTLATSSPFHPQLSDADNFSDSSPNKTLRTLQCFPRYIKNNWLCDDRDQLLRFSASEASSCLLLRHKANSSIGIKGQRVRPSTEFTSYLGFVKLWGYCSFTAPAFAVKLRCHSAVYTKLPVKIITAAVTLATDG